MRASRVFPVVMIAAAAGFVSASRAAEPDERCEEFLRQVVEERRAIEAARALREQRAPAPPAARSAAQQLLDEERLRAELEKLREELRAEEPAEPPGRAPEELERRAREFIGDEQRRAADRQAEQVDRLLAAARDHLETGRFDAAARAAETALTIEPGSDEALALRERIESAWTVTADVEWEITLARERERSLRYIDEYRVPQADVIAYPDDWEERKAQTEPMAEFASGEPPDPQDAAMRDALAETISIEAVAMPLDEIAAYLRTVADINIVLDPDVRDRKVDLQLRDAPVRSVLDWVTKLTGLGYAVRGSVVYIGPAEELVDERVIRTYDVSDILRTERLFSRRRRKRDPFEDAPTTEELADDLMDFIKKITPGSWGEDPGQGHMSFHLGRLVVNAEPALHARVLEVLDNVRK